MIVYLLAPNQKRTHYWFLAIVLFQYQLNIHSETLLYIMVHTSLANKLPLNESGAMTTSMRSQPSLIYFFHLAE